MWLAQPLTAADENCTLPSERKGKRVTRWGDGVEVVAAGYVVHLALWELALRACGASLRQFLWCGHVSLPKCVEVYFLSTVNATTELRTQSAISLPLPLQRRRRVLQVLCGRCVMYTHIECQPLVIPAA